MCPCPYHLAIALAFVASFAGWFWMWLRGKRFEMKLKKHDKCQCHEARKDPPDQA
jgi:hypothetical protein